VSGTVYADGKPRLVDILMLAHIADRRGGSEYGSAVGVFVVVGSKPGLGGDG